MTAMKVFPNVPRKMLNAAATRLSFFTHPPKQPQSVCDNTDAQIYEGLKGKLQAALKGEADYAAYLEATEGLIRLCRGKSQFKAQAHQTLENLCMQIHNGKYQVAVGGLKGLIEAKPGIKPWALKPIVYERLVSRYKMLQEELVHECDDLEPDPTSPTPAA